LLKTLQTHILQNCNAIKNTIYIKILFLNIAKMDLNLKRPEESTLSPNGSLKFLTYKKHILIVGIQNKCHFIMCSRSGREKIFNVVYVKNARILFIPRTVERTKCRITNSFRGGSFVFWLHSSASFPSWRASC